MLKYLLLVSFTFFLQLAFAVDHLASIDFTKPHVKNEFIVKLKEGYGRSFFARTDVEVKKDFRASKAFLIKTSNSARTENLIEELRYSDAVEYIELNHIYENLLQITPNDKEYSNQYAHKKMSSEEAWKISTGSLNVKVAVIDTGIDYSHPDLKDNYWFNPGETGLDEDGNDKSTNGVDDDGNGYVDDFRGWDFINDDNDPMDDNSHGTHCAGIIGAKGNNSIGIAGINWEVSMMGIKIFSASGRTNTAAIIEGIEYATLMGMDLSNNSWGGSSYERSVEAAIKEAQKKGIVFVAAAGNNRSNNDSRVYYPAGYTMDNVVSVLSTDSGDRRSNFSNYGSATVHAGAPGTSVLSTIPDGEYSYKSGTSMAAPYVAGVIALAKSKFPDEGHVKLINRVLHSGDRLESLEGQSRTGRRVNASKIFSDDDVAPATLSHFELVNDGWWNVRFQYDKVGDDGLEGEAQFYDFRWSKNPITEENWSEAENLPIREREDLSEKRVEIKVRDIFGRGAFVGVRAIDKAGNYSPEIKTIEL